MEQFNLILYPYRKTGAYRLQVEVYYRSDQVIRFKLTGGDKTMKMQKLLMRKTNQWKIMEMNFTFKGKESDNAFTILEIQKRLDEYLGGSSGPRFNRKTNTV